MGRFTVSAKLDFSDVPVAVWEYGQQTDKKIVINSGDFKVILRGDFTEGAGGNLRGTVDTFVYERSGSEQFRGENLDTNAFTYFQDIEGSNLNPFSGWPEIVSSKDRFFGGSGQEFADFGYGGDTVYGRGGNDILGGENGNDTMYGGSGIDNLYGGVGNDRLYGGKHGDSLFGGLDSNTAYGGSGGDFYYGGSNLDTAYGGSGGDFLYGGLGADSFYGGAGDDFLFGGSNRDGLYGGSGDDTMYGGLGPDSLFGGTGNDVFGPNAGQTTLTGGKGADEYEFDTTSKGTTIIKDFGKGNDLLVLAELLVGGDLDGSQIYNQYGSKKNGHTFIEVEDTVIKLNNYTTTSAGWGDDILTY